MPQLKRWQEIQNACAPLTLWGGLLCSRYPFDVLLLTSLLLLTVSQSDLTGIWRRQREQRELMCVFWPPSAKQQALFAGEEDTMVFLFKASTSESLSGLKGSEGWKDREGVKKVFLTNATCLDTGWGHLTCNLLLLGVWPASFLQVSKYFIKKRTLKHKGYAKKRWY